MRWSHIRRSKSPSRRRWRRRASDRQHSLDATRTCRPDSPKIPAPLRRGWSRIQRKPSRPALEELAQMFLAAAEVPEDPAFHELTPYLDEFNAFRNGQHHASMAMVVFPSLTP